VSRTPRAIALTAAVSAGCGVLLSVVAGWGSPAWWALPALAAGVWLSESAAVRLVIGRQGFSFTLSDAIIAVGFVLAPGSWVTVAVLLGFGLANARSPVLKLSFNLANYAGSVTAGVAVTTLLGGDMQAACVGLLVFYVLNHMLTAVPVSLTSGEPYHRVILATGRLGLLHYAGNISLGLLGAWLALHAPWGLLGLIVPLGLLWWSYQQQTRRASEAKLFAELAQGQERVSGGQVDASAEVVVTAAARLFGGADVEMLLRHPDGLLRYIGDEQGVSARLRADATALDAPWVLRALAARGVLSGQEGDRPFCSAVFGDPDQPLAVLIARRPARAGGFTRPDAQLAEVLVRQAESWLSVADLAAQHDAAVGRAEVYGAASRVLGDLGADTVPALAVLRESANRLSRLASSFGGPDPVSEIVAELHAVERAVAALLGAIALASDPLPARPVPGLPALLAAPGPRGEAEWTTTGRMEDIVAS
jgi:hypothetical protein